jgi:hypothetical protein
VAEWRSAVRVSLSPPVASLWVVRASPSRLAALVVLGWVEPASAAPVSAVAASRSAVVASAWAAAATELQLA